MNKTYNVVFNKSIGEYQVTSELTSNRKKTKSTKRILVTMASLLLTAAVNISNAQIKVDEGRTELHNASDISGDLSNVSFNIKDRDILSLDALKNAFKAYMADPHNEDYEKIDKSLHGYTTSIHESIEDESLGHLYMAKDMALTLSKTIHSDSDQNIVIRADKDHELKLSGATTTLFNNANTLIMSGKDSSLYPSSTMSIRDNKVVGNLIENSGDAYFDSIIFVNNRGKITNLGTMLFQSSSFGSNEGVLIDNHGDLVIKDSSFSNHQGVFFTTRGDTIIDSSVFERNNHDGAVKPSLNMIGIDGGTTIIRNSIFRDSNQAAISVDKPSILIVEHSLFENLRVDTNNAGALDGYVAKKLQVFDTTFKENHTSSHGGAVAFVAGDGSEDSRLFKNSDFIKNSAGEWGAAIYGYSDFTIAVDEGKRSTFSGNIAQDNGSGSGYEANSIASANNSVTLQVDGILDMRDPMYAFNTVKKLGLGRWMLGGNNRNITNLEVQEGELYLYREGETENANKYSYDSQVAAGNLTLSGDFTLGAVGKYATLSVNGNQIQANNISLNNSGIDGGTTLIFRIDGTTSLADSILMLAGNTQVDNLVTIDIDSYDLQDTTYQLVETTGQADLDLSQYQLTINGSSPLDGNRLENGFSLGYGSNKKIIELAASNLENVVNIWGDKAGNELDLWSELHDKNWSHSTGEFLSGDIAVFNGNRAGTVRIADNIRSAAIIVNGTEDYALQGTIIIDEEKTTFKNSPNNYYNVLGKLIVGAQEGSPFSHHFSGVLDLTATKNNQFSNGIEIESGTLKVSALDQLGKNTLYLSFTGNSDGTLLVTDDADITIGNDHPLILNIEEGKSARIKTEKNAELTFNSFTLNAKTSLTLEGTKDHLIRFNDANMLIRDGELIADYVHFDNSFVQLYGIYETHLEPLDISIKNSLFENSYTGLWFNDLGDEHTANINIENTIFRKNSTGIENHYRGGISISGSTFIDNGTLNEPAGSVISSGAYLKLENSLIANNIGGYTLFLKDSANINNTRFEGNIVTSTSYGSGEGGGAIFVDHWNGEDSKAEVNLVETSFINNSSIVADEGLEEALIGNGGAISLKSGVINIDRGTFSDNTAARKGGAIVGADDPRFEHEKFDRTFNITNTTFTGNSAGIDGGAIYGVFKALNITDTDFENNIATTGKGGAINFGGTLNLGAKDQDVIFSGNTANGVSSGIYAQDNAVLNIDVASGKKLEMRDALTGGSSVDVTKKGAGNWMLSGASSFTGGTKFLVEEGILALDHQASIILASGGKESIFSLGKSGQNTTLLAHGDNKIETDGGKIVLDAGSDENTSTTFSFKVTDKNQIATKDDANKDNAVLSLDGSLLLDGNNQFNVDVDLSDIKSGNSGLSYYSLLYSMQGGMVADRFKLSKNLTYQGENISNIDRLAGLSLLFSDDQKSIVLQNGQDSSKILTAIASWKGDGSIWKSVGNWSTVDSDGKKADRSIFISGDFADFSLADNTPQTIILDPETGTIDTAGIYVSGNTDYLFDGDGLNTSKHQTTFKDHFGNPLESDGKLILGQKVVLDETTGFLVAQGQDEGVNFTGTVDLTQTAKNSFEGGVEIYGGTLKISHEDQLGVTSLHDLTLAGSQDNHATLLVADGNHVNFTDQVLAVATGTFAALKGEGTATLTFDRGGINNQGNLMLENVVFTNEGGISISQNHGKLILNQVSLLGNGYGIVSQGIVDILIQDSIFKDHESRAIDHNGGSITIENGEFNSNSNAGGHGGAIWSYAQINIVGNTLFSENKAAYGGAIANRDVLNIEGAIFSKNNATAFGGAIYSYEHTGHQLTINEATFTENSAEEDGGAIYLTQNTESTITDTDFIGNIATTGEGGAIYNAGILNLNVSDNGSSIFEGNSAHGESSALYLADGSSLNMNIGQDGLLDMQDQFSGENTTVTKNGLGTWKLAGDNALTGSSSVIFNEGIVEFTKGSGVRLDDELFGFGGSVTFGNANTDTRIIINGRNTITANSALFNTGVNGSTTFEFNLDDSNYSRTDTPADYAKLAALKVSFDRISQGDIRQGVQFEINDTDSLDSGFYTLYYNMSYNHLDSLFKDTIADFNSRHNQDRNNLMTLHDKMGTILLEKGMIYRGIARWTGLESLWDSKGSFAVTDAKGRIWDQFAANDYAIFGLTDGSNQWVNLNDTMQTAGIYVSGDSNYHFEGTGLAANKVDMSDFTNGLMSQGKLVLGQVFDDQLAISDQAFTGIVDLTDTDHNSFVGGVDVYSGTLKVATKDQLGTSLNQLNLSGSKDNTATLAIAKDADLTFNNETLTVASGKFAALDLESDATVTFTGNQNGWDINGGTLTLNTAAGAILDIQNMIYSSGGEINKVGEGSFKLAGNQQFVNHSKVNIQEGIFELAEDATLDLEGSNSLFIMGSEGKHSTFIASGNNTIKVGGTNNNIIFNSGDDQGTSTTLKLKVDATNGISTIGDASAQNAVLTFAGNVQITGSNGVNIDLFGLSSGATGLYTLLYTTGTTAFNQADFSLNQNITFQGRAISDIARLSGMGLIVEDNAVILDKGGTILTSVATWTGAEGNLIWDGVSSNWNVTDSSGKLWNTFMNGDFVNFAALAANGTQNMTIRDAVESAGVYVSGDTSYLFSGEGITTKALATTFNPHNISDGKFVLGQQVLIENSGKELNVLDEAFTGLVDLTGITGKNRFEGGIDIFGGTLRVASKDQLGTTLDNILLAGTKTNTATLAIKEGSHIAFTNETLTVGNDHDATLNLEQDAEVIFNSNGNAGKGLEINGGSLALNTAAGTILDFHNQISGNDATLTKAGLGTLKLAGNNHFTGKSNVSFLEGTVNLADKSSLELQGAGSLLTLGGNGKTTRIVANGHNTLNVNGDLVLNNSVDLTFAFNVTKDNYSATQAGIGSSIAVLNLEVDKIILSNAANAGGIQVDLLGSNLAGLDQGYYTLLNSNAELKEGLFDSNIKGHTNQDRFNTLFLAQDKNRLVLEKDIVYSGIANWLGGSQWANAGSNWSATDSKGRTWKEFANNDYANFGLVGATQTIDLGVDTVNTAGLYFNGDATYTFTGKGLNTAILETTFGANSNEMSLGKLVLGQNIVANGSSANITDKTFSGVVDLTGTAANHFEGGIDIYGGTLRVANEKQLGTTLDDLTLAGNSADNVATLQLASNGKLNLKDQTLTIDSGFAKLDLEKDAQMSLAGTNAGIALNGGTLMLNTTLGSIFDLNQMTGNGANDATFNKTGQGTLKLAGHNTFAGKTGFNILEGVFNLAENGSINLQGQGSSLTLGSSGKNTTFVINGKNSLNVNGDIVFQGGGANGNTILSFNVTDANYITALSQAGSGNAALTLGDFEVKDGPIKIDIAGISSSHDSGLYTLLYTTGMFKEGDFNLKNPLTYQGQNITDIARLKELSLLMKEDAIVLNKGKLYTGVATWKGGAVWDSVSNNWNVKDSSGQSWNTFMSSDFVNFAANGKQSIRIGEDLHGADIFFQGNGEYLFSEKGLAAKVITSTFEPGKVSTGKLVLGQSISHDLTISDSAFTGIVDLTKTVANSFEGGIDIYGGTLRILGEKQLGTTLDKLNLAGSSSNVATLAIAEKGSLQLEDQTLTIADGKYGALNLEKDAIVTLANSAANANGQQGLVINGGNFVLNTALGAIFDLQNGLAGTHGDFTKLGEGSFKLAGQNSLAGTSHFNIVEGTMDLAKAGELTLEGAGSSFTLGAEGKRVTLVANGKNAINVNGDVILNTGKKLAEGSKDPVTDTSLSFNLTDDNHIATIGDASKDNAALYLGGTLKIEGDNRVNININSLKSSHNEGLYTLLFTANQLDANKFNLQHNLTYQGRAVADIARLKHITLVVDDNVIALDKGTLYTGVATWKDPADAKDAVWDSVSENWTVLDSNGGKWNTFLEGDVVNFASEKSQSISLKEAIVAADIFVSGKANYTFNGEGITIKKLATTFDPATTGMSSGKLVLGQIMNDQFLVDGTAQGIEYSGRVDLTGTQKNSFEGGIDIYGGTLRIATNDQLGTSLDNVSLLGQSNGSIATLAVKSDSDLHFINETLTVSNGHYGRLQLERDAKVTFEGGSDMTDPNYKAHGINIDGGLLTLNTATGSVIDMKNGLTGHDATLNKIGSGSLKLQGDTNLTGTSRVNIQEGLVDLANNGSFTLNGAGSSFTLGSTGRHTSLQLAGNNSIDVEGDILLNTGGKNGSTTLAFDVKDENRFDINKGETASKDNAVLNINASGDLKTSSEGKITIDIASLASNQAGLYTLLYTQNFLDPSKFSASLSYKGRATANIERLNVLDIEVGDHSIVLNQGVIYNGNAVWTGALADSNGMAIWDVAEKNWKVTDSAGKTWETFIDRDSVVFGDLPGKNQNIKIQAGATGHLVESMLVNSQYDYHFSGDQITMENGLMKDGKGSLIFNNSGLTGDLILNEGMLVIGGGKSALDVKGDVTANKGTLAGFATIDGDVLIGKGATLSPGYGNQPNATAFGTLTAHSFNFKEGSTFVVDADEKGNHDKIIASIKNGGSGIVSIEKDVAMDVRAGAGSWHAGQSVVVVEADTEVDGSFDKLTTNLDFLDASLDYSQKDQVTLNLKRNDNSFNSVGLTYNGRAVAGALDGLSNDHAVSKAFQGMTFAEAAKSFDNISGEIYASTQKAIFQSSRALGQKMQSRLALRESEATIGGMNPEGKDAFWMEALGYDGTVKSDNNAAKMERKGGGLLIGYDRLISTSHNFTLGVAGGYEDMKLKLKDTRDSESKVKSVHLMTYMGTDLGDSGFNLKAGLNYSYLRYNTDRNININSIAGVAKSKHKGHQYQVFAEVSRMFDVPEFNNMQMTPYVGVAHTEVKSNSFRESGSLAALEANRQSNQQTSAVIGVRNNWFFGEQNEFALRTDLGWQYEFGNEYQDYDLRFVGAGPSYNIRSTTNGRSSALIGVGFTGKHDNLEFNVGYQGQFGSKVQDHAINANLIWWLKYDDNGRNLE